MDLIYLFLFSNIFHFHTLETVTFEIKLPNTLPPTHRGKVIRISYQLILGIQRDDPSKSAEIFQLPFRVYNRVEGEEMR